MFYKEHKILSFFLFSLVILAMPVLAEAYNVAGVVEFSYRNYDTKIGNTRTSQSTFIQNYRANLQDYLFDPRFLQFNAGIGYSVNSTSGQDSSTLNYNLSASFFPQSKINWSVFGNKATTTIESNSNIAGYDLTTSSYGASLNLLFSGLSGGYNNNNYNSNNNNNSYRRGIPLPSIMLSHIHTDSDSENASNPIHEKRDDANGSITYRFNPSFDLRLDGGLQSYENTITKASYDTRTANLASTINVSKEGELRISGRITDTKTDNMSGFQSDSKTHTYSAILDFKEKNGWKHYYRYDNSGQDVSNSEYTSQKGEAYISYRILPQLQAKVGINYSIADLLTKATGTTPEQGSNVKSADAVTGVTYIKTYPFTVLYPFTFTTNYDFTYGYSKVESQMAGVQEGTGVYYINQGGLGLTGSGWQKESLNLTYNILSRRDNSPLSNDILQQTFRFDFNTKRITNTILRAKVDYYSQENRSSANANIFSPFPSDTRQQRRSFTYDVGADYAPIVNLTLSAGAQRAETKSSFTTLSTLEPISSVKDMQNLYYAAALFNYAFTRNLVFRANLREEMSHAATVDTQRHIVNMNLDYRFRQIFVNFEYRWRQEDPDNAVKTTQQYYFVKLSRPF